MDVVLPRRVCGASTLQDGHLRCAELLTITQHARCEGLEHQRGWAVIAGSAGAAGADGGSLDALLEGTLRMAYPWGGADAVLEMLRGIRKAVEEAEARKQA